MPFASLGEQLRSVVAAGTPGGQVDQRLYEVRAALGANEAVGSDGGFLLQQDYSAALLTEGMAAAKLAPRCRAFPIGPNSNSIDLPALDETSRVAGSRFGGLQLASGDESDTISATKPKFRKISLKLNRLTGACYLSDEIVQDATVLENFVRASFTSEFGFVIHDVILRGTGAGRPLGILNSPALVTVAKEAGQVAKSLVTENIVSMYSRSTNPEGSIWIANADTLPQLMTMTIGISTAGQLVSVLQQGIGTSPTGMALLGRPVIFMEQCASLGTVGDVLLVDPQRYLLASKGGLQTAVSMHVQFLTAQQVIRFIYRLDGQPDLNSAITPANGTATQSPFVALATRA